MYESKLGFKPCANFEENILIKPLGVPLFYGYETINWHFIPAKLSERERNMNTRGNDKRIYGQKFPSKEINNNYAAVSSRMDFLTNRIVKDWNALPDHVVNAPSVNAFKARLDEWLS